MPEWTEEYLTMVEDCEKRESRMTEWEIGFIDSMRNWIESGKPLSPKQTEIIDRIWERVTG